MTLRKVLACSIFLLLPIFAQAEDAQPLARYYAPAMLSQIPISRSDVPVPSFDPSKGIDWSHPHVLHVEIDLDQMMQGILKAIQSLKQEGFTRDERKALSAIRSELAHGISEKVVKIYGSPDQVAEGQLFYLGALSQNLDFAYNRKAAILRKLPNSPGLASSHFAPWKETDVSLEAARFFDFEITYPSVATQDKLHIEILDENTNPPLAANKTADAKSSDSDLVARLVQFHSLYSEIQPHLSGDGSAVARAALLDLLGKISKSYREWKEPVSHSTRAQDVSTGVLISEGKNDQGDFVAQIIPKELASAELVFDGFHSTPGPSEHSFIYVDSTGKHLRWSAVRKEMHRLRIRKLDALAFHAISIRSWIVRNSEVKNGDSPVVPEFVFDSRPVELSTKFPEEITHSEQIELGKMDGHDSHQKHTLSYFIAAFYSKPLGTTAKLPLSVSLDVSGYFTDASHPAIKIPLLNIGSFKFNAISDWTQEGPCDDAKPSSICELSHAIAESYHHVAQSHPISSLHFVMKIVQQGETKLTLSNVTLGTENVEGFSSN